MHYTTPFRSAETAEQKELRLSRRREADRARRAARTTEQRDAVTAEEE